MYSLRQAADAVGRGKPAILKAIKNGRISAQKDAFGQWQIEPGELHRVYAVVTGNGSGTGASEREEISKKPAIWEATLLRYANAFLRKRTH